MAEDNNVQKSKRLKPMSKRPIERSKTRWEDDVLEDIKSMNVRNWKKIVRNRQLEEISSVSQNLIQVVALYNNNNNNNNNNTALLFSYDNRLNFIIIIKKLSIYLHFQNCFL